MQHELVKAVSGPLATKQRVAAKAARKAQERLEQVQGQLQEVDDAPHQRGPGCPPQTRASLEQLAQDAQAACQEFEHISAQREQVTQSIRRIGQSYHFVDVRREAQ